MNYLKQNHLSILIIVFLIGSALLGSGQKFGALDRTTVGNPWTFSGAVTHSGTLTNSSTVANNGIVTNNAGVIQSYTNSTSSKASLALIQADILNYSVILMNPIGAPPTITFPATSTLTSLVPAAGDMQRQCWFNATTTTSELGAITYAAGTGIDLEVASTSATESLVHLGGNAVCFTYIRKANTDILLLMEPFQDGD